MVTFSLFFLDLCFSKCALFFGIVIWKEFASSAFEEMEILKDAVPRSLRSEKTYARERACNQFCWNTTQRCFFFFLVLGRKLANGVEHSGFACRLRSPLALS